MPDNEALVELAVALRKRGYRTEVIPADPPDAPFGGVNVWSSPYDRYPFTTVYEPGGTGEFKDEWVWGPFFEHHAEIIEGSYAQLAHTIAQTVPLGDSP